MPFDDLPCAVHNTGVARAQGHRYAQFLFNRSHIGSLDGFHLKARVTHVIDPPGTAATIGVLVNSNGVLGCLGEGRRRCQSDRSKPGFHEQDSRNLLNRWRRRRISCAVAMRSEEHTSELQSLMRISYAVFCLKKK